MHHSELSVAPSAPLLCSSSPIGIFDSGIGGLTISSCIEQILPNEQFIYLADNKFAPYGDKSAEFVIERVNQIAEFFIKQNVKAIVIACNTATVIAIEQLRARISIPVIGVEPAIKPAALTTRKQKVGILTTQATANNPRFLNLVQRHKENTEVYIQACPGLVEQIEQGLFTDETTQQLLMKYILPLKAKGIDKLVLGCTHYPMLNSQIKNMMGDDIELIDTGLPVAKQLNTVLTKMNLLNKQKSAGHIWLSSQLLKENIKEIFPYHWQVININ